MYLFIMGTCCMVVVIPDGVACDRAECSDCSGSVGVCVEGRSAWTDVVPVYEDCTSCLLVVVCACTMSAEVVVAARGRIA